MQLALNALSSFAPLMYEHCVVVTGEWYFVRQSDEVDDKLVDMRMHLKCSIDSALVNAFQPILKSLVDE